MGDNDEVRDDSIRKIASSPYFKLSTVAVVMFRHNAGLRGVVSELGSLVFVSWTRRNVKCVRFFKDFGHFQELVRW